MEKWKTGNTIYAVMEVGHMTHKQGHDRKRDFGERARDSERFSGEALSAKESKLIEEMKEKNKAMCTDLDSNWLLH